MVRYLILSFVFLGVSVILPSLTSAELLLDIALHDAAKKSYTSEVDKFINAGADVNAIDESKIAMLHMTALDDHNSVVRPLIFVEAIVSVKEELALTPLHGAPNQGHLSGTYMLIAAVADIKFTMNDRKTLLHLADFLRHKAVVTRLIEKGAKVNTKDKKEPLRFT